MATREGRGKEEDIVLRNSETVVQHCTQVLKSQPAHLGHIIYMLKNVNQRSGNLV